VKEGSEIITNRTTTIKEDEFSNYQIHEDAVKRWASMVSIASEEDASGRTEDDGISLLGLDFVDDANDLDDDFFDYITANEKK